MVVAQRAAIDTLQRENALLKQNAQLTQELADVRARIAADAVSESTELRKAIADKDSALTLQKAEIERLRAKRSGINANLTKIAVGVTIGLVLRGLLK